MAPRLTPSHPRSGGHGTSLWGGAARAQSGPDNGPSFSAAELRVLEHAADILGVPVSTLASAQCPRPLTPQSPFISDSRAVVASAGVPQSGADPVGGGDGLVYDDFLWDLDLSDFTNPPNQGNEIQAPAGAFLHASDPRLDNCLNEASPPTDATLTDYLQQCIPQSTSNGLPLVLLPRTPASQQPTLGRGRQTQPKAARAVKGNAVTKPGDGVQNSMQSSKRPTQRVSRGSFKTIKQRVETGLTRGAVACIRCRQQRIRVRSLPPFSLRPNSLTPPDSAFPIFLISVAAASHVQQSQALLW